MKNKRKSSKSKQALAKIIVYAGVYFNDSKMINIVKMAEKGLK